MLQKLEAGRDVKVTGQAKRYDIMHSHHDRHHKISAVKSVTDKWNIAYLSVRLGVIMGVVIVCVLSENEAI